MAMLINYDCKMFIKFSSLVACFFCLLIDCPSWANSQKAQNRVVFFSKMSAEGKVYLEFVEISLNIKTLSNIVNVCVYSQGQGLDCSIGKGLTLVGSGLTHKH